MGSRRGGRRRQGRAERDAGVGTGNHRIRIKNLAMARVSKLGANTKDREDQIEMEGLRKPVEADQSPIPPAPEKVGSDQEKAAARPRISPERGAKRGSHACVRVCKLGGSESRGLDRAGVWPKPVWV
jgi:hypothetical protein